MPLSLFHVQEGCRARSDRRIRLQLSGRLHRFLNKCLAIGSLLVSSARLRPRESCASDRKPPCPERKNRMVDSCTKVNEQKAAASFKLSWRRSTVSVPTDRRKRPPGRFDHKTACDHTRVQTSVITSSAAGPKDDGTPGSALAGVIVTVDGR